MKIAITGHTSGIGKAIYDGIGHEVVGFSRDTGHNINDIFHRMKIVDSVADCDVFINNAHDRFNQVNMLNELYQNCSTAKEN